MGSTLNMIISLSHCLVLRGNFSDHTHNIYLKEVFNCVWNMRYLQNTMDTNERGIFHVDPKDTTPDKSQHQSPLSSHVGLDDWKEEIRLIFYHAIDLSITHNGEYPCVMVKLWDEDISWKYKILMDSTWERWYCVWVSLWSLISQRGVKLETSISFWEVE